jgi:hypothetical protein
MNANARPGWFWVVAVLALLWNLVGLFMFWQNVTMTPEALAMLPAEQQTIHAAMPVWVHAFFGIAVIAGVLGSIALLLKKRSAQPLLLVSLLAVVVQMASAYMVTPVWSLTGAYGAVFPLVLIVIALLFWLFARMAVRRGWIG